MSLLSKAPPSNFFDDDDDDGWQEMPVVREDTSNCDLDEEDQKRYHYKAPIKTSQSTNATGNLIDIDDRGNEWRSKQEQNENEYTRLRINEEDESDEVHLRTKYLFDEDKAMTPLSQMQATKNLLTEAQRIAYVGLCALTSREMIQKLKTTEKKEMKEAMKNMELWALKIMGRLYYHMELETPEQKMIESLGQHGVQPEDLVPALMTTHTIANPEYDPEEARKQAARQEPVHPDSDDDEPFGQMAAITPSASAPSASSPSKTPITTTSKSFQTTARVLEDTTTASMPGVTTTLSATEKNVTLDIRWTVLCDLFLILIADSVYDARSRVLLESVALKLGLGWLDVVRFESRVTEALEIQEDVDKMENSDIVEGRKKSEKKQRYVMMGLATLGGGLVIGLSAGLLAPVIGAGLGAAFAAIGVTGTTGFLAGAGGAAVITTGGVLTGSSIAARGMARRTQEVRTFDVLPLHNNKRVSCILTVPGFMTGLQDDVRLPFSVLDPVVGDVFSVLWEPEMIRETGSALRILTTEVLTQIGQTVLQATVMTALMSALQWPLVLTKLGYLIDNPWNNALDRAKAAGRVLADVLIHRHLGVRPITLIGFSLGARVIFYALLELARQKIYGIVQDVFILGATLSVSAKTWCEARSVVSGRFVNVFSRGDWVLNYLFRATSGGVNTVAGLRPVEGVPGLENIDVTDKIAGHISYRTFMPLILDQLGFPVSADYFNEPEEPDFEGDRVVIREEEVEEKKGWFSRKKSKPSLQQHVSRPPSAANFPRLQKARSDSTTTSSTPRTSQDDDLPPREPATRSVVSPSKTASSELPTAVQDGMPNQPEIPMHAGFDFAAIKNVLKDGDPAASGQHHALRSSASVASFSSAAEPSYLSGRSVSTPAVHRTSRDHLSSAFGRSLNISDDEDDQDDYSEQLRTPTATAILPPSQNPFLTAQESTRPPSPPAYMTAPVWTSDGSTAVSSSIPFTHNTLNSTSFASPSPFGSSTSTYPLPSSSSTATPSLSSSAAYRSPFLSSSSSASRSLPYTSSSNNNASSPIPTLSFGDAFGNVGAAPSSSSDYGFGGGLGGGGGRGGLSFGTLDGTITTGPTAASSNPSGLDFVGGGWGGPKRGDTWAIPDNVGLGKKKDGGVGGGGGFNANPWS